MNYCNRTNKKVLAVFVEQLAIALKVVIALIIPDVPAKVTADEKKRELIMDQVEKELFEVKLKGGHESFQDMTDRLQREATKIMEETLQRQAEEEEAGIDDHQKKKMQKKRAIDKQN